MSSPGFSKLKRTLPLTPSIGKLSVKTQNSSPITPIVGKQDKILRFALAEPKSSPQKKCVGQGPVSVKRKMKCNDNGCEILCGESPLIPAPQKIIEGDGSDVCSLFSKSNLVDNHIPIMLNDEDPKKQKDIILEADVYPPLQTERNCLQKHSMNSSSPGKENVPFRDVLPAPCRKLPSIPVTSSQTCPMSPLRNVEEKHCPPKLIANSECLTEIPSMSSFKTRAFAICQTGEKSMDMVFDNSSVVVAVRVRPFSSRESVSANLKNIVSMNGNTTALELETGAKHEFAFDFSLWSFNTVNEVSVYKSQEDVYKLLGAPLLDRSFEGYNTCLFAYGQTGSGKSYTMTGYEDSEAGIIPRFCQELFARIKVWNELQYTVEISYYEIYNEKIHDLLFFSSGNKSKLKVREHPEHGPYVQDLSTYAVSSFKDIQDWMEVGNKNRATAATGMNDRSSRSHSVFTIMLTQTKIEHFEDTETVLEKKSKINLIDLAGSERASNVLGRGLNADTAVANSRLKEGGCINKSLHTLGKVISVLSERERDQDRKRISYIPYRDSVLTWILKESLGGNAKTAMIATISPANLHYAETLSTLRYAQQARNIVNKAKVNEDPKAKLIRDMLAEIQRLKEVQQSPVGGTPKPGYDEVEELRIKLKEAHLALAGSRRSYQEKMAASEKHKRDEAEHLRRSGISFKVDSRLPNLVNLNEDPQLCGVLLYILKDGTTRVGSGASLSSENDIHLTGQLVAEEHCYLYCENDLVFLSPSGDAPTYVNGVQIFERVELHHGDRIVIGGDHFFRLNHPKEAANLVAASRRKLPGESLVKDFEFAKTELVKKQNERLEAELEEARLKAEEDFLSQIRCAQEKADAEMMSQQALFRDQIDKLNAILNDVMFKKNEAEEKQQSAQNIINQLKEHQKALEDEILSNRKRLCIEALASKQALEETELNRLRILSELENEKQRMQNDLDRMRNGKVHREQVRSGVRAAFQLAGAGGAAGTASERDLLRTSLMLREANKIGQLLKKSVTLSRDDICIDGKVEVRIRLNNTKEGRTTLWSLETFEDRLNLMRDLYQNYGEDDDGENGVDPFCHPDDKWTIDFKLDMPASPGKPRMSISKRDSMNLMTSLNISLASASCKEKATLEDSMTRKSSTLGSGDCIFAKYRPTAGSADLSAIPHNPLELDQVLPTARSPFAESSRLSSTGDSLPAPVSEDSGISGATSDQSTVSVSDLQSLFESFLDMVDSANESPLIMRLVAIVLRLSEDWKSLRAFDSSSQAYLHAASSLKILHEHARTLVSLHGEAKNKDLSKMSRALLKSALEACSIAKLSAKVNGAGQPAARSMEDVLLEILELLGALSLGAIDHVTEDSGVYYFGDQTTSATMARHFLGRQFSFLSSMVSQTMNSIEDGIEEIKGLQLSSSHQMSNDLVDGVMNMLTSGLTLLQLTNDFLDVNLACNVEFWHCYTTRDCSLLRSLLSAVVTFREDHAVLVEDAMRTASDCDFMESMLEVAVDIAENTKEISATVKAIKDVVCSTKSFEEEAVSDYCTVHDKLEFASKAALVAATILIQEIEKDLHIGEADSLVVVVEEKQPIMRDRSMCPLNSSRLSMGSWRTPLSMKMRKIRRSSIHVGPLLDVEKYCR